MIRREARRRKPSSVALGEQIARNEAVKNVDETGVRVEGITRYLHVKCTEAPTAFRISASRKHLLPA